MQSNDIADLINRVAIGDRVAFRALYKATNPRLFAICLRILKHRPDAEEAFQEVYIKIWQRAATSGLIQISPSQRPLLAQLSAPGNPVSLLATFDDSNGRVTLIPVATGRQEGKSLQLWFVPEGGNPRSLDVFRPDVNGELIILDDLRHTIGVGSTLAVSLEPFGGSPTGLPTGLIIATGTAGPL